jgi:hypothetical protein
MTTTTSIEPLLERLLEGGDLSPRDRDALVASRDLLALGMAADEIRRRRHGAQITFVRVASVAVDRAAAGDARWEGTPGEVRITGAPVDLAQAVAAVRAAVAAAGSLPVTGFSLADIEAGTSGAAGAASWIAALRDAGLGALCEAPVDRLQAPEPLLAAAREVGLPVARLSVERAPQGREAAILARASALVREFPALDVLAPLPQRLEGNAPSTGYEDVRQVALARLLVPVAHIQVDWQRYGPKLAQVALTFGADDLDDVSPREAGAEGRRRSPLEEVRRNIEAASGEPVERAALFGRR